MGLSRTQIENWNAGGLLAIADAWDGVGVGVEDLFERYRGAVIKNGDTYWEGPAADAAQTRAESDHKMAMNMADALNGLAETARLGFHELNARLSTARTSIAEAEAAGFAVSDRLSLAETLRGHDDPGRAEAIFAFSERIAEDAAAVEMTDRSISDQLESRRADLAALVVSTGSLGDDQARTDGEALVSNPSSLTTEQLQRLTEAGSLTDEQIAALERGDTTSIPASQLEYLERLTRSLDGRTPGEISEIFNALPEDARIGFANSLQILSNESITSSVAGDPAVPSHGGLDRLPDGIRQSLTREDLVTTMSTRSDSYPSISGPTIVTTTLNGVADNQAIAAIAGSADDRYQVGTALDRSLLDVGSQYLAAQVEQERDSGLLHPRVLLDGIDPIKSGERLTEDIFAAVAPDKVVLADALTGDAGSDLTQNIFTHEWSDDGAAVSQLFSFEPGEQMVTDPNDPADVAAATQAGRIFSGVGSALSTDEAWQLVSNVPGTDGQSIGQLNPELVRQAADGIRFYTSELVGNDITRDLYPGFDGRDWIDPNDNHSFSGSANVFAALSADEVAGRSMLEGSIGATSAHYAAYGNDFHLDTGHGNLQVAGRIIGLQEAGLQQALVDQYHDEARAAEVGYSRGTDAYDSLRSVVLGGLAEIPGGSLAGGLIGAADGNLRDAMFGAPDNAGGPPAVPGANLDRGLYSAVEALNNSGQISPETVQKYPAIFRPDGSLYSWEEVHERGSSQTLQYRVVIGDVSGDPSALEAGYSQTGN